MSRNRVRLIGVAVALGVVALAAAVLIPVFSRAKENAKAPNCQSNLKQIGLGFLQYVQDYDEKLPPHSLNPVATSKSPFSQPYGWADAIQPYIKSLRLYQCPNEETQIKPELDAVLAGFTDYYYNTNLSAMPAKSVIYPASTILAADGNDGIDLTDARYNRNSLPLAWLQEKNSPAHRHLDGANYLFVDGHVKWLKPENIKNTRLSISDYSFAIK